MDQFIGTTHLGYTILREIGEGGMGKVYLAENQMIGQQVAIKILDPVLARNPDLRERFAQEARIQVALQHQNIVRVLNAQSSEELSFLIMEYIEGQSLDKVLKRRGKLSVDESIKIFAQVLDAVGYAHDKGIIHRDLKPSNIMVCADGTTKVTDFGIAKVLGDTKLTRTGTSMGSPDYMSPEQVLGKKDIDHRTDIYSLGATLYEMLTGRPPFVIENGGTSDSDFLIKTAHVNQTPISPHELASGLDQGISTVVLKALEKAPSSRFKNCEEFSSLFSLLKALPEKTDVAIKTEGVPRGNSIWSSFFATKRITRKAYFGEWLYCFFVIFILELFSPSFRQAGSLFRELTLLGIYIFLIKQGINRINDVGKSGWFIIVPFYNLVLILSPGTKGENKYGPSPVGTMIKSQSANSANTASGSNLATGFGAKHLALAFSAGLLIFGVGSFLISRESRNSKTVQNDPIELSKRVEKQHADERVKNKTSDTNMSAQPLGKNGDSQETSNSLKANGSSPQPANKSASMSLEELQVQECERGNWNKDCFVKAKDFRNSKKKKNVISARKIFQRGCEQSDMDSCVFVAYMMDTGEGGKIDKSTARSLYTKACDGGHARGCSNLGLMFENSEGGPTDKAEARRLFSKACDGGDAAGCYNLGVTFARGEGGPTDKEEARRLYSKACDGGIVGGCFNLGLMVYTGDGGPTDKEEARKLLTKACDGGHAPGCYNLGYMFGNGEGGPTDKEEARRLYSKACDGGVADGCVNLGLMFDRGEGGSTDKREALRLYSKACDGGDAIGCSNLGGMFAGGDGGPVDKNKARKLFEKACKMGEKEACKWAP